MAVLAHDEILKALKTGEIRIEPLSLDQVQAASVDLHIGHEFRVFKKAHGVFRVTEDANYEEVTELVHVPEGESFLLMPGETVLGITREQIWLSPNVCGWLEGRSRFARLGLLVHVSCGFMQPGLQGTRQVLELSNVSPIPLAIIPGARICQFVFDRMLGEARYEGRFKDQLRP